MLLYELVLHLFLPHTSNKHKAKVLHPSFLTVIISLVMTFQFALTSLPNLVPQVLGYTSNISPEEIVELTNKKRIEVGVPELSLDPNLTAAALAKGAHMLANDYWAHVAPNGTEPWRFFVDAGYKYRFAGENLARDFVEPEAVVDAWMSSPTHKDNLLAARYQDIGVAVVEGELNGVPTTVVVQLFGTKLSAVGVGELEDRSAATTPAVLTGNTGVAGESLKENLSKALISPFQATKNLSLIIGGIFLLVLIADVTIISRRKIIRVSSKTFAHLSFLALVIAAVLVTRSGVIL